MFDDIVNFINYALYRYILVILLALEGKTEYSQ